MNPTPRHCEEPGCEDGRIDHAQTDLHGDPIGPAIWRDCPECLGTGKLHVHCAGCNEMVPWHAAVLDEEIGEYQCSPCHREAYL